MHIKWTEEEIRTMHVDRNKSMRKRGLPQLLVHDVHIEGRPHARPPRSTACSAPSSFSPNHPLHITIRNFLSDTILNNC